MIPLRLLTVLPLALVLSNCSALKKDAAEASAGPVKVPTVANTSYRGPSYAMPSARNPNVNLPSNISGVSGVSHSRGAVTHPYIAMTFDDGPHPRNTPRLLDMLRQRNIKATFYVIGENVERYPSIARRIVAEGHEIGNHTWTHANLTKLSDASVRKEMTRTRSIIVSTTGVKPRTMRPPYGALLTRQRQMIYNEFGYPTIMWSVDPRDWQRPGVSVVRDRILSGTNNGAIVLAHDLHAPTVDAMPGTLDGLLNKGFKFVTVSQLLALKGAAQ
ncbi:MAG: polysaccharide deacetylase family protein [Akkermansiaceae bacterium]|nr:polysaccharide deacetylase family protein [Akkermansiaceae bacterium]NNM29093.1 polysaccharide deacetylase family protein [Akkermansiaceae bacterium]